MHLHVCWEKDLGGLFFIISSIVGWGIPCLFVAMCLVFTGVSYRLGDVCLPNHPNVFVTFLGWVIAFAGLAAIIQLSTLGYTLYIYVLSLKYSNKRTAMHRGVPQGGVRMVPTRQAWRKVQRLVLAQWRILLLISLIVFESIYFSSVFLYQDRRQSSINPSNPNRFVTCLIFAGGDKNQCLQFSGELVADESAVVASLAIVAVSVRTRERTRKRS